MSNFLTDLSTIRLASMIEERKKGKKGRLKVDYRLEQVPDELQKTAEVLELNDQNLRFKLPFGVYNRGVNISNNINRLQSFSARL